MMLCCENRCRVCRCEATKLLLKIMNSVIDVWISQQGGHNAGEALGSISALLHSLCDIEMVLLTSAVHDVVSCICSDLQQTTDCSMGLVTMIQYPWFG